MQEHTSLGAGLVVCLKANFIRECIVEGLKQTVDKTQVEGHLILPPTYDQEAVTMYQQLMRHICMDD